MNPAKRAPAARVCFVGPLPPPTHGMANMNAEMVRLLRARAPVSAYSVAGAPGSRGLRYHATKTLRLGAALLGLLRARLNGCRAFYGSVDDGWGGIGTAMVALVARLSGCRIHLHHHSFRYVDRRMLPMRLLACAAGPDACHIMLCDAMEAGFREQYPAVRRTVVVPNAVPAPQPHAAAPQGRDFTIGMMSNLMFDKGVREFVELFEAARAAGMKISAVLAGPAWDEDVAAYVADAVARNGGALQWQGPVYGDAKEAFFVAIDAFVFPTRYASECYPLVIVEALGRGKPVISTDQGCIAGLAACRSVDVVRRGDDFVPVALALTQELAARPRDQCAVEALSDAAAINARATEARDRLIDQILSD